MRAHELKPGDLFVHEGDLTLLERLEGPTKVVAGLLAIPFRKKESKPDGPVSFLPADEVVVVHEKVAPV